MRSTPDRRGVSSPAAVPEAPPEEVFHRAAAAVLGDRLAQEAVQVVVVRAVLGRRRRRHDAPPQRGKVVSGPVDSAGAIAPVVQDDFVDEGVPLVRGRGADGGRADPGGGREGAGAVVRGVVPQGMELRRRRDGGLVSRWLDLHAIFFLGGVLGCFTGEETGARWVGGEASSKQETLGGAVSKSSVELWNSLCRDSEYRERETGCIS